MRHSVRLTVVALVLPSLFACGDDGSGPQFGSIRVSVATEGGDPDDAYVLTLDGEPAGAIGTGGEALLAELPTGMHSVELGGVASNCTVAGSNPRTVSVVAGSPVPVGFVVNCVATGVRVVVTTSGIDLDPDGYTATVSGGDPEALGVNSTLVISRLAAGEHTVTISGLAANCTAAPANAASVTVPSSQVVDVAFAITCVGTTGRLQVAVTQTGIDLDMDGFVLRVDGGAPRTLPAVGTAVVEGLSGGAHTVTLEGAAANCVVGADNPRSVTVPVGGTTRLTAETTFAVTCGAAFAAIEITPTTSGLDRDPDGYRVEIGGWGEATVPANGSAVIQPLPSGTYDVSLGDIASNCIMAGNAVRQVTVTTGGARRDTARVAVSIDCSRHWELAFVRPVFDQDDYYYGTPTITLARPADNALANLTQGEEPDWSRDANRIAYRSISCDYYYCLGHGLFTIAVDGSAETRLTTGQGDNEPAWRPDGQKIVFTRPNDQGLSTLYIMNADGSGPSPFPMPAQVVWASSPSWSPDGLQLAFVCRVDDEEVEICRVNADGSGFLRLTDASGMNQRPVWSPDGSRILFTTNRDGTSRLATMNPDGSGVTIVTSVAGIQPTWAAGGTRIVFVEFACDIYTGCRHLGLGSVNADGSGYVKLSDNVDARTPAWRP